MSDGFKGFVAYRPGKPTNRLEGEHHVDLSKWAPSVHYSQNLAEIRNQLTPSEAYKLALQTSGKLARDIQKLEARMRASPLTWARLATRVQAWLRATWARREFVKYRALLMRERDIREARYNFIKAYEQNRPYDALQILADTTEPPLDMQLNACKVLYAMKEVAACVAQCRVVMRIDSENADAQYILGSCFALQGQLDDAYEVLKTMINLTGPRQDACKLNAYVCMKLVPPKYDAARLNMDFLVDEDPADMNVLLQRGCVCCNMQDWGAAVDDFSLVLGYQPHLNNVRLLRARAYACAREWDDAKDDYEEILKYEPDNWWALEGMSEVIQPYDELPMIDESVIDGAK